MYVRNLNYSTDLILEIENNFYVVYDPYRFRVLVMEVLGSYVITEGRKLITEEVTVIVQSVKRSGGLKLEDLF